MFVNQGSEGRGEGRRGKRGKAFIPESRVQSCGHHTISTARARSGSSGVFSCNSRIRITELVLSKGVYRYLNL